MNRIIVPSRKLWVPPRRQRGFFCLPTGIGMIRPSGGGGGVDPYFSNVVLLLNMGGADGSTTFTDSAPSPHTMTANGNAQIDTSLGFNAGMFDGDGDYLSTPYSADHNLTSGDWTIEGYGRFTGLSGADMHLICKDGVSGSSFPQYSVTVNSGGKLSAAVGSGGGVSYSQSVTGTSTISSATNFHWAFCKQGSTLRLYLYGSQEASATQSGTMTNNASKGVLIGYQEGQPVTRFWPGWIWAVRMTKGVCRYPNGTTFTPPSAPFPTS